jgi:hypothetical protein
LTEFYRATGVVLSEKVYYEDQEYATLPFRDVKTVLPLDMMIYGYIMGDKGQSVSNENRVTHIGEVERVLWLLWERRRKAPEMASEAADYFTYKMSHVLFSYYVTALLINPDRREGRVQARVLREKLRMRAAILCKTTGWKYRGVFMLHYLGITWGSLVAIQHTGVYRVLFKAAS